MSAVSLLLRRGGGHWAFPLFAILVVVLAAPPSRGPMPVILLALVLLAETGGILFAWLRPARTGWRTVVCDVAGLGSGFLLVWHVVTSHTRWLDAQLFPPPETIVRLFLNELPLMVKGAWGSMVKLLIGYGSALVCGVSMGLALGADKRLFHVAVPFARAIGPIPPIIYIPYAICFLPGFTAAQVFVISIGAFWPVFLGTLNGIQNIPGSQLDVARTLNLHGFSLKWRILLPGALPSICSGAVMGLIFAFVMLTAAELIGSSSGVGWYIKNYADYGDFERVIVGVIFVGILALAVTLVTDRIERRLLNWCD